MANTEQSLSERLRAYVFEQLLADKSSPLLNSMRDEVTRQVSEEFSRREAMLVEHVTRRAQADMAKDFERRVADLQKRYEDAFAKVENRRADSLPANIKSLPKELADLRDELDEISHALGNLPSDGGHGYAHSSEPTHDAPRRTKKKKRSPHAGGFSVGLGEAFNWLIGGALAVGLLFLGALALQAWMASRPGGPLPEAPLRGDSDVDLRGGSDEPAYERGWQTVLRSYPRLTSSVGSGGALSALCTGTPDCTYADLAPEKRELALQIAMEALAIQFECSPQFTPLDGEIGREATARFRVIAQCVAEAPSATREACAEPSCSLPAAVGGFDVATKADWVDAATRWALDILGHAE